MERLEESYTEMLQTHGRNRYDRGLGIGMTLQALPADEARQFRRGKGAILRATIMGCESRSGGYELFCAGRVGAVLQGMGRLRYLGRLARRGHRATGDNPLARIGAILQGHGSGKRQHKGMAGRKLARDYGPITGGLESMGKGAQPEGENCPMSLKSRLDRLEKELGATDDGPPQCTCNRPAIVVVWDDPPDELPAGVNICPVCGGEYTLVRLTWDDLEMQENEHQGQS